MGWRLGSALGLALLAGGCSEFSQVSNSPMFDWTSTPLTTGSIPPAPPVSAQAYPSFRYGELRPGLTKADLQALYPNRLAFDSGDGRNELYFVELPGARANTTRDRLVLWLNDGRLASFDILPTSEPVAVAAVTQPLPQAEPRYTGALPSRAAPRRTGSLPSGAAPQGKYGVQIAAPQSEADARRAIDTLRAKHPKLLVKEWATINRVELPNGVFYRVVVGPYATAQQAERLCSSLKAEGAPCFIRGT